eukprot:snap_masked-scaffold_7-processed-gene-15.31-mRNA-1 protein AED:1.00 eAED:1.00 QI:0/0/0/0/1/1/3/0/71
MFLNASFSFFLKHQLTLCFHPHLDNSSCFVICWIELFNLIIITIRLLGVDLQSLASIRAISTVIVRNLRFS